MNRVTDNNFNFFEDKKKTRVRVVTASPEELERQSFFNSVFGKVNSNLSDVNNGIGELDDDIKKALRSKTNEQGNTDDYYASQSKKTNSVVEAISEDLKNKLTRKNEIDSITKKRMDKFLETLGTTNNDQESLNSLEDILSAFNTSIGTNDSTLAEEFKSFLRNLKKLMDSLKVSKGKIMIDLSRMLDLLNTESPALSDIVGKYLRGLIFPLEGTIIPDNIQLFLDKIKSIKSIKEESADLLVKIIKKRYNVDMSPVDVYNFSEYGITDSNVPQLLEDSNIERLLIDDKEVSSYIDTPVAKDFIASLNSKEVSMPVWTQDTWQSNNEKRLKEFYKVSRSADTGTKNVPEWTKNNYVNILNSLLRPEIKAGTDGMNPGVDPDVFARLITQSFFTSNPNHPTVRSNVTLKNGVMIPQEIKLTKFENKETLSKGFFEIDEKEFVKMFTQVTRNGSSLHNNLLGHATLPHIQMSSETNLTSIGELTERQEARANMEVQHAIHSSAIKCLLRKMPDFRPNMYYGVISQYDENDEQINDILGITSKMPFEKPLGSQLEQILRTYFVRMQRVSINGMSIEPTTWNFMGKPIPKVSSSFTESHKTELEFSLDQNGLILNKFNALAGIYGSDFEDTVKFGDIENKYYSQTFFPSTFFNNKSRIDITIMYNDFNFNKEGHFGSYGATQKLIMNDSQAIDNPKLGKTYGYQNSYRAFVFEDVRFLGSNSTLKFERDSAGRISAIAVPILYKRISTIDNNF